MEDVGYNMERILWKEVPCSTESVLLMMDVFLGGRMAYGFWSLLDRVVRCQALGV